MIFNILTLFPEMFECLNYSILKRARENELLQIKTFNIRDYTEDKHNRVDDYPYGGGQGMIMQVQPLKSAIDAVEKLYGYKPYTILMSPRGIKYNQNVAKKLVDKNNIMLICGHYEGIDERVMDYVDLQVSIGDFVLTGGEIACMAIVDSVSRMVDGVLSCNECYEDESFYSGLLEYPQYTRPEEIDGKRVPDVLLSGHHENIRKWRKYESLKITYEKRPDLLSKANLNDEDKKMLKEIINKSNNSCQNNK